MLDRPGIPKSEEAVTVDWMQRALVAGGTCDVLALKDMSVEQIGTRSGFVGTLLRCHLTYHEDTSTGPRSVIVKLPSKNAKARRVSRTLSLYKREYDFYSVLGPDAPISSPALLYGEFDERSRLFVLVLEDLSHMEFFDRFHVASVEQASIAIRAIARLHGQYWDKQDQPPLSGLYQFSSPRNRVLLHLAYLLSVGPVLKRFGHIFSDETRRLFEAYPARLDSQFLQFSAKPQTFVHGDYHLGNIVFGVDRPDDMSVIDWQVCGVSCGMEDVATFTVTGLSSEMRRKIERELLEEYHGIICSMGVQAYTFQDCWKTYRQYVLSRLVTLAIAAAVVETSDPEAMKAAENYLRRLQTAIGELEAQELLPSTRRFWSLSNVFSISSTLAYKTGKILR